MDSPTEPLNQNLKNNWIGDKDDPLFGFSWRNGVDRDTTGIIMWSDVFLYDAPNGERIAIILMDTQGLFDHGSSPTENSRIFSLSNLISSVQIFNLFNNIQEDHLEYLQFATEYAKYVTTSRKDSAKPFQNLTFLIRDWNYSYDFAYGLEGGENYLEKVLEIKDQLKPELKSLREYIFQSFDKISCFLMPHPGKMVASKKDFDGRWAQIDPEFIANLKVLVETLLTPENLTVKKINHGKLEAGELFTYICQYGEMYKSPDLPKIKTIGEATVYNHMQILITKAFSFYTKKVNVELQNLENEKDVEYLHEIAEKEALQFFDEARKMGLTVQEENSREKLIKKVSENFEVWRAPAIAQIERNIILKKQVERLEAEKQRHDSTGCITGSFQNCKNQCCCRTLSYIIGCCYRKV